MSILKQTDLQLSKEVFSKKIMNLYRKGTITEEQKTQAFVWFDKHKPKQETIFDKYSDVYQEFKRRY